MLDILGEANAVALLGLLGGMLLGLAARIGRFCTLGAIEDLLYSSDDRRMRMWGVAIGIAIIGTHIAMHTGAMASGEAAYLDRVWNPIATIVGGLMFGYGMALSGNCGYGALARLGGGDIRAFVIVIVLGLSAYVVMSGPLAHARIWLFPVEEGAANPQGFAHLLKTTLGLSPLFTGLLAGGAILAVSLASKRMLTSPMMILWGVAVGAVIVSGWVGTYWVANVGFGNEPVESHSFAAPIGDTIYYAMTASGNMLSFSVGSVVGVVFGAFLGSIRKGHFRWEACDDPRELKRQMFGAALMGPGAILTMGCSVGQGLSAFSVLSYSAPVTFIAIMVGAALGLRHLIAGLHFAE
ncbi:putative inner membrane protein [Shimia sp. SK013]|uniref:YeeE/YedE family protein n=1 Tax=Shimia sp. SK013 TaxID=1389006 RepID=UPI0006B530EE|nr:YeeE/YedE family protein [Shimia sp. SK013]KPA22855.1 putative inner membrane protein [Shimia sp. SK013]